MSGGPKELVFDLAGIRESGGFQAEVELAPRALFAQAPEASQAAGPFRARLEFSIGGNRILLEYRLEGAWRVPCSRCLRPHDVPFESAGEETYPASDEKLDLGTEIREAALIEIPQRSLCRPDCKGFCPQCGKDLGEGPCGCTSPQAHPFDVLKKLRGQKE